MNIRNLQSNFLKLPQDNLIKFLYDIILQDIRDVENYKEGFIYSKGDRVYLQENNKHHIFQCLVDESSPLFIDNEWSHVLEVYNGDIDKLYNIELKEEIHYIEEYNREVIYTNLEFKSSQSSVTIYCGKRRYVANYDFIIEGNRITFKQPFNIGDRLILEVREISGKIPDMLYIVLYDLNGIPYRVGLNYIGELNIEKHDTTSNYDVKYGELVTGDRTYTLLVDGGSKPYELKAYRKVETYITGTNGEIFKVDTNDGKLHLMDCSHDRTAYSDTKYILGLDKKFYTLSIVNNEIVATEAFDTGLEIRNVDLGVRFINHRFESLLICIDNGNVSVLPYIDNGGYRYINFIDQVSKNIVRLSVTDENSLELNEGLAEDGLSGTRLLDYFYFFDEEWNYNRMFVNDGELYYEDCPLNVIPDSKGINLLRKDGEMTKLRIPNSGVGIHVVNCVSLDNHGTFESPIEGFVVDVNGETMLATVNKDATGFELIPTQLPFRTNHHYVMSPDNKLYKLTIENNTVKFIEGINPGTPTITYIDAEGIYYYLLENEDGEVEITSTYELPENANVGMLVNEYKGINYRLIDINGELMFVKVEPEECVNACKHVMCSNNTERMCYFSITNEEFFLSLMQHESINYIEEYEIECITIGAYIKSYERITRFDIVNGEVVLKPISTFKHRIKSVDGNVYVIDVVGEPYEEVLSFTPIEYAGFTEELGSGDLYLQDVNGIKYVANIDEMGRFVFEEQGIDCFVDYDITSLIQSSQGLYRIVINDENIKLEKMFDNMYESDVLSYGNLVKKSLNVQVEENKWFAFAANGLGEVIIKEADELDATGLLLQSDDGFNYGLGMIENRFVTYKSFISHPVVHKKLFIKDSLTGVSHALFMSGNRLCSETTNEVNASDFLLVHDAYNNKYKLEMLGNVLTVSSL